MPATIFRMDAQVQGLDRIMAKLESSHLLDDPFNDGIADIVLKWEGDAKREVGVDTGQGRRNITHQVDRRRRLGRVGFTVRHLRYHHGDFDEKKTHTKPHFPPLDPLRAWARRHGIPVFAVALAIARRGTAFNPFLSKAMKMNEGYVKQRVGRIMDDIGRKWGG